MSYAVNIRCYNYVHPHYVYAPVYWPMAPVEPVLKRILPMLPSDSLPNTLPLFMQRLKLLDFIRLSLCNKSLAQTCREQLTAGNTHLAHQLLQDAVVDVAALDLAPTGPGSRQRKKVATQQLEQLQRAVPWLLGCMGSKPLFTGKVQGSAFEQETADLLVMQGSPTIQLATAVRLVQSGLRVSYSQLVKAARAGVSGIEVWGRAMQQCGVSTDIPDYAQGAAICTWEWFNEKVSDDISGQQLADYLYLIANGIPEIDSGRPRNRTNCQLARMEEIARNKQGEKLSTEDILGIIKLMSRYPQAKGWGVAFLLLCDLPAKASVTVEQIVQPGGLLDIGMKNRSTEMVHACLHSFPAGKQVGPGVVVQLFRKLIAIGAKQRLRLDERLELKYIAQSLVISAGAQQITAAATADLIRAVLATGNLQQKDLLHEILRLPAVQQIDIDTHVQLREYAVHMGLMQLKMDLVMAFHVPHALTMMLG